MSNNTAEQTVLVLVDVQVKLFAHMTDRERLLDQLRVLLQGAQQLDIPVLWCQQVPEALGPTVPEVAQCLNNITPINKSDFSCWQEDGFRKRLCQERRSHVLLCGIETHICIFQTALDLLCHDFSVEVVGDATSSRTLSNHQAGLERIRQEGGKLGTVEMSLFDLLASSRHPQFRPISRLVK